MSGRFTFTASSGDVVQMIKVPNGFHVEELRLAPIASSATAAITMLVGDGDDPNRYMSASLSAVINPRLGFGLPTGANVNYTYTANDTIDVTISSITGSDSATQVMVIGLVAFGSVDFQT